MKQSFSFNEEDPKPRETTVPSVRVTYVDLRVLDTSALLKMQDDAQALVDMIKEVMQTRARAEVERIAKSAGLDLRELASKPKRAPQNLKTYANPEDRTQTWSGRGAKPMWLIEAMGKGRKKEEFLVQP